METETFNSCTHVEKCPFKEGERSSRTRCLGTQTTNKEHTHYYKMDCNRISGYYNVFEFVQHFVIMLQY